MSKHTKEEIQHWLIQKLSEELNIPTRKITTDKAFSEFGLSSLSLVSIEGDIEEWLGIEMDPMLLWEYPTIELISEELLKLVPGDLREG